MLGSCETRRMLRRIEADWCLSDHVVDQFLNAVLVEVGISALAPNLPYRMRASWAKNCVLQALAKVADQVCVRGPEVASNAFSGLLRIRPARDYRWCLPTRNRQQFFEEFGIEPDEWVRADDGQLRLWIEAHYADYTGAIETAGRSGPAFVTDESALPSPTPSFQELQHLLGLSFPAANRTLGIMWRYSRSSLEAQGLRLCVPRSVDGLDYPPFDMKKHCGAPYGHARQPNGDEGLPEAIHKGCQMPGQPSITVEILK